jgi:inhibitor of cysteine peptidase
VVAVQPAGAIYIGPMPRLVAPLLLVTLLLAACGRDSDDSVVIYRQPGESITVGTGTRFAVELEANPTTGYTWQMTADPGGQVQLVGSDYAATGTQLPGSGGTQTFTFQAAATGTTSLAFGYVRPWETGVAPVKTATFPVKVT